jgi:AbrB family looped-hinge helix DNA binding protein
MLMKVFSKGQVVIPVEIRHNLGIEPGDFVNVTLDYPNKKIELSPQSTAVATTLAGSLAKYKRRKPFPDKKEMNSALRKGMLYES